jgi:tetratricopeptide (TPR) repeat protein
VAIPFVSSHAQDFKTLSEQAAKASQENRLSEAAALYRKALAIRPRWTEGWWSFGTLQYDQNQYAQAAAAFQKLILLRPDNGTAHAMLGLCQIELNQDDQALKNLSLARNLGVQNDQRLQHVVLFQLSRVQLRKRKFGDAVEVLTLLVKDGVRSQEVVNALGMAALRVEPPNAPAENTPGRDVVDRVGRAQMLTILKDFEPAKQIFALLATEYPSYPELHFAFGRCLLEAHEIDAAVAEFQKELQQNPKHVSSLMQIAAVRYRLDSADGVKYAEQAVKLSPQLPFAHYLLGLLYMDTDRAAEALPELEIARKAFAKHPQVYFALGNAYARLGRKVDAAHMRAEFVRLNAAEKAQKEATGSGIYGDQTSGILGEKLDQQTSQPPPKP